MGNQAKEDNWQVLFAEWSDRFLLFSRQQTRTLADAEDVLQEAMIRLWSNREIFPRIDAGLVFTQIRRTAIDQARRDQRRQDREARYVQDGEPPYFETSSGQNESGQVEEILRFLPTGQREVLVLKIWGEMTFDEIGKTLDISPNTAASRYRYGLERLRSAMKAESIE